MPQKKVNSDPPNKKRVSAPRLPSTLAGQTESSESLPEYVTVRTSKPPTPAAQATEAVQIKESAAVDSPDTDKAVDDIVAKESDLVLAVDDMLAANKSEKPSSSSWADRFKKLIHSKWTWISIVVILCALFAFPTTRYKIVGLFIKKQVSISVIDSQTQTPVSDAEVSINGAKDKTNANGDVTIKASIGGQTILVSKQYYRSATLHYFVALKSPKPVTIKLVATGRLVPITVINSISGKPVSGAEVHILSTSVKTNSSGLATVALPIDSSSYEASVDLSGYNVKKSPIVLTNVPVPANTISLTPSGTVVFLSNQSGILNVVKSNLDGSNRQTILAGTPTETPATTRLIASKDWQYVILQANRDGTRPALYVIDTSNDQVSEFDNSNAAFNLIGWYGHNFVYSLTTNNEPQSQADVQAIKEYDADNQQLNLIDEDQILGSGASYAYQAFSNFYIINNSLVYSAMWMDEGNYDLSNANDVIRAVNLSSQVKSDQESFAAATTGIIQSTQYQPEAVYFAVQTTAGTVTYYQYQNQTAQTAAIDQATFQKAYPSYIDSPSGDHTLWSTGNDAGVLFVGDTNGNNPSQVTLSGNYSPYGWYGENYLLVSQKNNQLSIVPTSGLAAGRTPLSITSYYEPASSGGYEYGGY